MTIRMNRKIFGKIFIALLFCLGGAQNASALSVNEIMVANIDCYVDPSWNYGAWVELYNPLATACNIKGYWISDDVNNLKKVHVTQSIIVPANGYKNLWFDHYDKYSPTQVNLKLDADGGTIYISDPKGNLLICQDYPPSIPRASWACLSNGEWGYTSTPTPEKKNDGVVLCEERLEAPSVSPESKIFKGSLVVHVDKPSGTTLRYTTDGTTPTMTNGTTSITGSFVVSKTTIYRFALFRNGFLSSPVITRSYLLQDKDFSLPVISVVTDSRNLYSDELGIFVRGVNGRAGRGQSGKCNWNMDWDRPANFDLMTYDGNSLVNQEVDILRCGGWNRVHAPYSFKVHASKIYEGKNTIDACAFRGKPYNRYKTLQMRNGGNDSNGRVTDAFIQKLVQTSGMDVDVQDYEPVAHYINGVYKGVINMREPTNKHYVQANYGLDEDEIDMFEMNNDSGYIQKQGTEDAYNKIYTLSKQASNDAVYDQISQFLDIEEFCNYNAVQMYLCNWDWPQNNMKGWRPAKEGGRFRFILFDTERAFEESNPFSSFAARQYYTFDRLYNEPVSAWSAEIKYVTIFLNLLKNKQFRRRFIDSFCLVAGSVFEPNRCQQLIQEWTRYVEPMQILPDNGYGKNNSPWDSANRLLNNLKSHTKPMVTLLQAYAPMQLGSSTPRQLKLNSNISGAQFSLNGISVPTGKFNGQIFTPATIKVETPVGYEFDGWIKENADNFLVASGDSWTYKDNGNLDNSPWKSLGYGTSSWSNGSTPFSLNSLQQTTVYFRKNVKLEAAPTAEDVFKLDYTVKGGFIVYVNGVEAFRQDMPSGDPTSDTFASKTHLEKQDGSMVLESSLFKKGINILAVEIHRGSKEEGSLYWNAALSTFSDGESLSNYCSQDAEFNVPDEDLVLTAHFSKKAVSETTFTPVIINEISAGNSIYVNDYFKKGDWVELFNTTDNDIDLSGMYLSDDEEAPHKYTISNEGTSVSTILPAHGYKVIWCDDRTPISQLHAPFKLANEDNAIVMLTASDDSWNSRFQYCAHDGTESIGRYPDGTDSLYVMDKPSIDASNRVTMYSLSYSVSTHEDGLAQMASSHQGEMKLFFKNDALWISAESACNVILHVYTIEGTLCMETSLTYDCQNRAVDLSILKSGTYIARTSNSLGEECSIKFIKK